MQLSYAISSFDIKHNFESATNIELPFDRAFRASNRWTRDWRLSGITHFSTGFPVTMVNNGDNSLLGTNPNGVNNASIDEPQVYAGPLETQLQSAKRQQLLQYVGIQPAALGNTRKQPAPFLLRARI